MVSVLSRGAGADVQRQAVLTGDLVRDLPDLLLHRFSAVERLSDPFTFQIEAISKTAVDFVPHLGATVGVKVNDTAGVARRFTGRLFEARRLSETDGGHAYELTIRPWFYLLSLNLNTRVFTGKTALQVVGEVLKGHKHRVDASARGDDARDYCVQYRESDFAFVSRLLEEEGFYYFFEHTESGEEMVICGGPSAHHPANRVEVVPYRDQGSQMGDLSFWDWSERITPVPSTVTLRDHHHLLQGALTVSQSTTKVQPAARGPAHESELYDYPAGSGGIQKEAGLDGRTQRFSAIRLEAARAEQRRFVGEGNVFGVACGARFTLQEHTEGAWNQEYLVVGATHALGAQNYQSGHGGGELLVTVETVPFSTRWRPPLRTPRPVVAGPTTAVVIGVSGDAVDVDEHGRVLVKFNWDRRTGSGPELGVRLRVSQGWAGNEYGFQAIPRIGTEVIVDFVDGDPDLPVITGRLHSSTLAPPLTLPAHSTRTTWKSQTIGKSGAYDGAEEPPKGGVGFNEIRMEDEGGSEELYVHAQRLRSDWTRLDEKKKVGRDMVERIGRDVTKEVKRHKTTIVETGDETRTLKAGSRKTVIKKADSLTLNTGDSTTTVESGNLSVDVSKGEIAITAKRRIVLKVGGSKVTMTPTGIEIEGGLINVKARSMMTVEGAMTTVKASGVLTAEGKLVMIN